MVANDDASIVYFEGGPVLFTNPGINKTKPSPKIPSREEAAESLLIAEWGESNDFPEQARRAKESNPDLVSALDWKARALYAGGLHYEIRDRATNQPVDLSINTELKELAWEIDQFKYRNRHYLLQAAIDFYDLFNVFPQLILEEGRNKITRIAAIEAANCRYKRRDKAGRLSTVLIHPLWSEWNSNEDDDRLTKVAIIDPLNADPTELKADKTGPLKYIFPLSYPTGKNYYQLSHWWSVKISKWLDFGNMIPEVKETILKNIALIRYHIQMPDYWMPERYKNWMSMTDAEKKAAIEKEFKIINEVLTKPSNAGKSIFTMFKVAQAKEYGGWKIEAVDDKMKDGALLADSSEATIKVFAATSIDPSLHGIVPGANGSNRSGSDKREALNIYMSLTQAHEDILLDPWHFTAWYNGWNTESHYIHWHMRKPILQTLNQVTPANRATIIPQDAN